MSVTYGFYNSINGDRKYNALEMSSIFDGIIVDGVYMSIGDALNVKSSGGMGITVGIGRAWFNHTWTLNDSIMPLTLESSDVLLNRIDAVVLEINNDSDVRKNTIKILKGTPASNPVKPSLIKSEMVNQYPLAYITIGKGVLSISQSNIENAIGTSACPYVTGVLKGMDIDNLIAQWGTQWAEWLSSNTDAWKAFMSGNTNEWKSFMAKNKDEWSDLINGNTSEFETWFEHMKDQLSEDAAGNLQLQVDNLNNAALGGDFVLKGSSVSVEYMGANRIASITAYGENAQGGTTEAPVPLTGISSVTVNDDVTELPIPRPLRRVGDVRDVCVTRQEYEGTEKLVVTYNVGFVELDGTEDWKTSVNKQKELIMSNFVSATTQKKQFCSHAAFEFNLSGAGFYIYENKLVFGANYTGKQLSLDEFKAYLAAQKAAGTPVQVAYQLAAPETYATDPLDIDNAAGPLTVMTGGEVRVEISDGLSNLEQEIDKKAPIDHASSNTTYGTGNATKFGHLKLSDSTVSGSNADAGVAATPKAVNDVHAKANAAQSTANAAQSTANAAMPKAGGTFTGNVAARSANTAGAYIRNIRVQDGPGNQFNTNFIIMVRK